MNAILWWSAQNAITIAILIAIVSLTCRLFRDRPAVQHVLWAVVLLKFVTPPVVSWPMSVERFWPARQSRGATDRRPDVLSTFLPMPRPNIDQGMFRVSSVRSHLSRRPIRLGRCPRQRSSRVPRSGRSAPSGSWGRPYAA